MVFYPNIKSNLLIGAWHIILHQWKSKMMSGRRKFPKFFKGGLVILQFNQNKKNVILEIFKERRKLLEIFLLLLINQQLTCFKSIISELPTK
ncbi:MAG: hypothetical protein CMD31_11990 [Flavobacteriales bacterium]|nr:hypothetical protein [Flavobacteriales bacterium]|tara:strand:- start:54863 stop:55138 length:276 start_codon:yes stop_codon:yes gene_type:complete